MNSAAPLSRRRPLAVVALLALMLGLFATRAAAQDAEPDEGTGDPGGTVVAEPADFTSRFRVRATPDEVPDGGQPGAAVTFDLRLDSASNTICYQISSVGVAAPFLSPAPTATHIHQGAPGEAGPPVVLFPNPRPQRDGTNRSEGCLQNNTVEDGFGLRAIEDDPSAFYVDIHTVDFPAGNVRAQLGTPIAAAGAPEINATTTMPAGQASAAATDDNTDGGEDEAEAAPMPAGGVAAGFGGLADSSRTIPTLVAALLLVALGSAQGRLIAQNRAAERRASRG